MRSYTAALALPRCLSDWLAVQSGTAIAFIPPPNGVPFWWGHSAVLGNDSTLSLAAKQVIANRDNLVFVSAASAWEIAIKKSLGKLSAPDDLEAQIEKNSFQSLPITISQALTVGKLPNHHNDPFDRVIIAQATCESMKIVTRDHKFELYDVSILKS